MTTPKNVMKMIKDSDVKYADFRFTDPRGKWQHVTFDISQIEEETFAEGMMFDGSSIAGWKAINESDMCLMPDPVTATIDPFFAETTMVITCDVLEPTTGEPYNRDPRGMAKKAEAMVKSMGVGDTVFFGPEAEFFVFDDVRFKADAYNTGFTIDSMEEVEVDEIVGSYLSRIGLATSADGRRTPSFSSFFAMRSAPCLVREKTRKVPSSSLSIWSSRPSFWSCMTV